MDLTRCRIPATEPDPVVAIIRRRRHQLLVHSALYYTWGESIVTDATWDSWAADLVALQAEYPSAARSVEFHDAFDGFDGSTGFDLPIDDPGIVRVASRLLRYAARD